MSVHGERHSLQPIQPDTLTRLRVRIEAIVAEVKSHTNKQILDLKETSHKQEKQSDVRFSRNEEISRNNAHALTEVKTELKSQRRDLAEVQTRVMELEIMGKLNPVDDKIKRLEKLYEKLESEHDEDSKTIRIIEGKLDDYKRKKNYPTPYGIKPVQMPPIPQEQATGQYQDIKLPSTLRDNLWKIAIAIFIAFVVGIGSAVIVLAKLWKDTPTVQKPPSVRVIDRQPPRQDDGKR